MARRQGTSAALAGRLWRAAQLIGLVLTAALICGFFVAPEAALSLLWDIAIPILPATFLINPVIWRNVCPLGTLNMLASGRLRDNPLPGRLLAGANGAGIALLLLMVPARRFLFNTNGTALALAILAVAALALSLGALFRRKGGFCNAVCPVLPVERLYGQSPLVKIGSAHCADCSQCVPRACIDVAPAKSVAQTLGRAGCSHAWLKTGYGVFATSFPGFVLGYYLTTDGPPSGAGSVYLTVAAAMLASHAASQLLVRGLRLSADTALRLLGALAIGLYYWFAGPVIAGHLALGAGAALVIRAAAFALIALWLWRAFGRPPAGLRRLGSIPR